uniref:Ig-like domain-containing protein n=1 Tax=Nothoprocta perdicaria TaxID=30464 RepID=A0A8C6ZZH0_NOTPE
MRSSLSLLKIYFFAGQFKIIPPDNPVIGVIGKGVILPCQLQAKTISERLSIQWIFTTNSENIDVSIYDGKNTQNPVTEDKRYQGRTNFFHTEFNKGNVSLYLKNVMVSDKGKYTCSVFFENWYDEVVVELSVAGEWKDRNFLPHSYLIAGRETSNNTFDALGHMIDQRGLGLRGDLQPSGMTAGDSEVYPIGAKLSVDNQVLIVLNVSQPLRESPTVYIFQMPSFLPPHLG